MSTEQTTWQQTPDLDAVQRLAGRLDSLSHMLTEASRAVRQGDPRNATADVAAVTRFLDVELARLVTLRRADGSTWRDVADDLGVSPQAAQQRYGRAK